MKHICETLIEYALSLGAVKIDELPGLWESQVNEQWKIKCNGHKEQIDGVPPFSWFIEYSGWPAGYIDVITGEGVLCAGEAGNEENLQKAIEQKMNLD